MDNAHQHRSPRDARGKDAQTDRSVLVFGSHLLFPQTDVELLVVVNAGDATVTQPLATTAPWCPHRIMMKIIIMMMPLIITFVSMRHHTRPVVEGKFYRLNNYNISRLLLLL